MNALNPAARLVAAALAAATATLPVPAQDAAKPENPAMIQLPTIQKTGGMPLREAIAKRQSAREFAPTALSNETLGAVLWAAAGYNRPAEHMRTAASTRNWQAVDVYAVLESGIYAYDAEKHALVLRAAGDHRALAGMQPFVATAPLNLLFVGDMKKMAVPDKAQQMLMLGADAGLMAQNVYLECASTGLACVIRASLDPAPLAKLLKLPAHQQVLLGQTIGLPAK